MAKVSMKSAKAHDTEYSHLLYYNFIINLNKCYYEENFLLSVPPPRIFYVHLHCDA